MANLLIDDRYMIKTKIGSGGFATVYLAYDKIQKKDVAIKLIDTDVDENNKTYQMFKQEAMTLAAISNPNIVNVFGTGIHNGKPFLIMEYVKGRSLKEILVANRFMLVDEVYSYINQVIDGLAKCHLAKIIHRDIKPQNIMRKSDGTVVLLDFGTAIVSEKELNHYNEDGKTAIGTVQYMAPELLKNPSGSIQTDIYALGITMFELFTGKFPFVANDPKDKVGLMMMHQHSPFPSIRAINPSVPEEFEAVVSKCCRKEPGQRYKNVNDLKLDLYTAYDLYKNKDPKKSKKFLKSVSKGK